MDWMDAFHGIMIGVVALHGGVWRCVLLKRGVRFVQDDFVLEKNIGEGAFGSIRLQRIVCEILKRRESIRRRSFGLCGVTKKISNRDRQVEKALSLKTTQLAEREFQIELLKCLRETGISRSPSRVLISVGEDLLLGIDYIPQDFLLDPRYAAPELYVMSTQTPSAPSPVIATALSPVLWQLNLPDRYSLGLMFLQMVFSKLRSESALIQFNEAHESRLSCVEKLGGRSAKSGRSTWLRDSGRRSWLGAAPSDDAV
ncbi:hypothetical protein SELMODRAFT_406427 [Selaginella moellendorffii]|uniref:Protein kinase domain-containing protein n=1 Tax=Selaginella moellendorffii TaxID=88036 RepID=D8R2C0_SELML|nr:hypothetical protein SELMODRAFT_406427 [Selaginella moellendorffii]